MYVCMWYAIVYTREGMEKKMGMKRRRKGYEGGRERDRVREGVGKGGRGRVGEREE